MPAYVLGIDQGTTQTTAVVLDRAGAVVARRSVRVASTYPQPGHVEQDPRAILQAVRAVAGPLAANYPLSATGFDNQGETFLLWDAATGQPLTPAVIWQDQRGAALCNELRPSVDADWLHAKTGLLLDSYFTGPKLRVLLDADPALAAAAQAGRLRFGTTESWVLWHLSGGALHVTDASTAARTLLYDIQRLAWDDELLDLFHVPRAILPEVRPAAGPVGALDFGAGRPVPLHALLVDQQAALFGQACFQPGAVKCTFGTGSFLLMNLGDTPRLSEHKLITTVAWQFPGQLAYALDGGIFVMGAAVQWLADDLGLLPDVTASAALAARSTDREVVCVPALAGLAAPYWQGQARGTFFGLSRATTQADLVRATLDGLACRVADVVAAMRADFAATGAAFPAYLKVDGGPTANTYLMQAVADLTDLEVRVAAAREATAIGVANLAAHSAWGVSLDELAARWQAEAVYTPRIPATERAARLERWRAAVASVLHFHGAAA